MSPKISIKPMIGLISSVFNIIFNGFFSGLPISNIKSSCYFEYATYLHDINYDEKAIEYFTKAITLNRNNSYAYGGLAIVYFEKKQFDKSLEYCKHGEKAGITIQILMQVIYEILGESSLAKEKLQQILDFYKNDLLIAYDRLAFTYFKIDKFNEAEHFNKEAITLNPVAPGFHYNLGMIYFKKNNLLESKAEFNKVLDLANDGNAKDRRFKRYALNKIESINEQLSQSESINSSTKKSVN